jgi:hypothetical protein
MSLPPGEYVLVTLTAGVMPAPARQEAKVVSGEVTRVDLTLDSGIR